MQQLLPKILSEPMLVFVVGPTATDCGPEVKFNTAQQESASAFPRISTFTRRNASSRPAYDLDDRREEIDIRQVVDARAGQPLAFS